MAGATGAPAIPVRTCSLDQDPTHLLSERSSVGVFARSLDAFLVSLDGRRTPCLAEGTANSAKPPASTEAARATRGRRAQLERTVISAVSLGRSPCRVFRVQDRARRRRKVVG